MSTKEFIEQARKLRPKQRAKIAEAMLDSITPEDKRTDDEWAEEINRRVTRVMTKGSKGKPWPEVRAEVEAHLRKTRKR